MSNNEKEHIKNPTRSRGKQRWIWRTLLLLFSLILLALLWFSYAINRQWGVHQIEHRVSKALHTKVQLDTFHFSLYSGLQLQGLLLLDHHKDTLLYAGHARINYHNLIGALLHRSITFDDATLRDIRITITTYSGETKSNWERIFAKPESTDRELATKDSPSHKWLDFAFSLKQVKAEDVFLSYANFDRHFDQYYDIPWIEAVIKSSDFKSKTFLFSSLSIASPEIVINRYSNTQRDTIGGVSHSSAEEEGDSSKVDSLLTDTTWNTPPPTPSQSKGFTLRFDRIEIVDGTLQYTNYKKPSGISIGNQKFIDWNDISLNSISTNCSDVIIIPGVINGQLDHLGFIEKSGFEVKEMCVDDFISTRDSMKAQVFQLFTRKGEISGDLRMDYDGFESFKYFVDDVYLQAKIKRSHFPVQDLLYFAPALYHTHYFSAHADNTLRLSGTIMGYVNALKGRKMVAEIPGGLSFRGNISTRDITHKGERFFSIKASPLLTSAATLTDILQLKGATGRFQKLGGIAFSGQFDGFIKDFVTYGTLESDLGIADMDMRLNLRPGIKNARYSGHMSLQNFALGTFTEVPDLGEVTLNAAVTEGRGLTIQTAKADLNAQVLSLDYRGYLYENLVFNGILNKSLIDGALSISEDNIDLEFKGLISDLDKQPKLDFTAKVKRLKLRPLHLNKKDIRFKGDMKVKLEGTNIDNSAGEIALHHLRIQRDTIVYELNEVHAIQKIFAGGLKTMDVKSDILDARFNGHYKLSALHKDFLRLFEKKHPHLYASMHLPSIQADSVQHFYNFIIDVKNLDPILPIITTQNIQWTSFNASGFYDSSLDSLDFTFNTPSLHYNDFQLDKIRFSGKEGKSKGKWTIQVDKAKRIGMKNYIKGIHASFELAKDTLLSDLSMIDSAANLDTFQLALISFPQEQGLVSYFGYRTKLVTRNGERWTIDPLNYFYIDSQSIDIRDFIAHSSRGKRMEISNIGARGLIASLSGIPTSVVDSLLRLPQLDFEGEMDLYIQIADIFKRINISGGVYAPDLGLRPVKLGETRISFKMKDFKSPMYLDLHAVKDRQELTAGGHIRFDSVFDPEVGKKVGYQFHADGTNLPLKAIKIIIPEGISKIKGTLTGKVHLQGIGKDKDLRGNVFVQKGQAKVDYIGVTYFLEKQNIRLKKNYIDFSGVILSDSLHNTAVVTGGMRHTYLRDPALNVTIQSEKILGLNTTKQDNPSYYGTAIGNLFIRFSGPLKRLNIDIKGITGKGTHLFIPTGYSKEEGKYRNNFIYFKNEVKKRDRKKEDDVLQLTVNMDMEIQEDAETSIIFDESTGDILKGSGIGKIHLSVLPGGQINMIGDYQVAKGNYLFTLFNIVNKPFVVQPGGTIHWNGDPLNAQLNITALYANLEAPLYPLIADYLENASDNIKSGAKRPRRVDLEMHITGPLFQPEISFTIKVPNLTGPLRSYAVARLNDINQNTASLNRQVFGLIVFNSFIPPSGIGGGLSASSIDYTASLSEFVSIQLSQLLTGAVKQALRDVGFVSDIQLNVAYKQVERFVGQNTKGGEYNFESTVDFIDAIRLRYKAVYANASITNNSPYLDNEFDIEVIKTGVDGLRFKFLIAQDHFINNAPRINFGIGATYKTQFDTLTWKQLLY